jgi:hypothetical protein
MKELTIRVKNVKKDGLPKSDPDKMYFVTHFYGSGFGTYENNKWRLDFDSLDNSDDVVTYFEIPDEVWENSEN